MKIFGIWIITVVGAMALGFSEWEAHRGSFAPSRPTPVAADHSTKSISDDLLKQESHSNHEAPTDAEATMRKKVEVLMRGEAFLDGIAGYTSKLQKQELVGGVLHEEETMEIKCRHHPFSIYLKWDTVDPGREVLFVDGRNDGKLVAHDGGWKSRLPAFTLDTEGSLAMRDARYPVTSAGLLGLLQTMLTVHKNDLDRLNFATCECHEGQSFAGRPCSLFVTTYKSAKDSPVYRKSITFIDEQWNIPVYSRHFEWPSKKSSNPSLSGEELDNSTIVESYSFTEIRFTDNLTDFDFDRTNPEYHFH